MNFSQSSCPLSATTNRMSAAHESSPGSCRETKPSAGQAELTIRRIGRYLRRRGLLREDPDEELDAEANLAASAVSGQTPPAGPQWVIRLAPLERRPLAYDKPLCASQDGFTLHAATRAGALDVSGRDALLRYVLRPPIGLRRRDEPVAGPMGATSQRLLRPQPPLPRTRSSTGQTAWSASS